MRRWARFLDTADRESRAYLDTPNDCKIDDQRLLGYSVTMSKSDDTADKTPDEVTMKDLWRHISGMEARIDERIQGVETRLTSKIDASRDELRADVGDLKGETQVIREVVDTLASQEDFAALDRKISSVSADTQATRQATHDVKAEVSRLRSDVKAAGLPVR